MDDFYVYLVTLPENIDEMIAPCEGGYTVYLDKRLPRTRAIKAFYHAVWHVCGHDWQKEDIQDIEGSTHERCEDSLPVSQVFVCVPD